MSFFTPVNQVRLTNVATVKLQKKGKRFEIACYRNKVLSWRNKLETDIREVLQIDNIFTNVSKGTLASNKDLVEVFGTSDHVLVCQEILEKGELQVSEQEREALHETVFRDIASIVADKTVNPENNRPYTVNIIQNAMKQIQYSVNVTKSSKSQALEVIRKLRDIMPIVRASMLIRIVCRQKDTPNIQPEIEKLNGILLQKTSNPSSMTGANAIEEENTHGEEYLDIKIDPENYRKIEELVSETTSKGRVEVLQLRMANAAGMSTTTATTANTLANSSTNVATATATVVVGNNTPSEITTKSQESEKKSKLVRIEGEEEDEEEDEEDDKAVNRQQHQGYHATSSSEDEEDANEATEDHQATSNKKSLEDSEDSEDSSSEALPTTVFITTKKLSKADLKKQKKNERRAQQPLPPPSSTEDDISLSSSVTNISNATPVPASSTDPIATTIIASSKMKMGKKEKRMEKEYLKEQEQQAKLLQERIRQRSAMSTSNSTNTPISTAEGTTTPTSTATVPVVAAVTVNSSESGGKMQSCNTCGGAFRDAKDYRDHFRSEWHRFNLKRKLKNLPIIPSEEAFLSLSVAELQLS